MAFTAEENGMRFGYLHVIFIYCFYSQRGCELLKGGEI